MEALGGGAISYERGVPVIIADVVLCCVVRSVSTRVFTT
jgi:hypothetical protein